MPRLADMYHIRKINSIPVWALEHPGLVENEQSPCICPKLLLSFAHHHQKFPAPQLQAVWTLSHCTQCLLFTSLNLCHTQNDLQSSEHEGATLISATIRDSRFIDLPMCESWTDEWHPGINYPELEHTVNLSSRPFCYMTMSEIPMLQNSTQYNKPHHFAISVSSWKAAQAQQIAVWTSPKMNSITLQIALPSLVEYLLLNLPQHQEHLSACILLQWWQSRPPWRAAYCPLLYYAVWSQVVDRLKDCFDLH